MIEAHKGREIQDALHFMRGEGGEVRGERIVLL